MPEPVKAGARAVDLLRRRPLWIVPLAIGATMITILTLLYVGSTVDPLGHTHDLPVSIVNEDRGAEREGRPLNLGSTVEAALLGNPEVTAKLALKRQDRAAAEARMRSADAYATVVIPPGFSASALTLAGWPPPSGAKPAVPEVEVLTNQRAGTEGASIATDVLGPALSAISVRLGRELERSAPAPTAATRAALSDPIAQRQVQFRPLPSHAALGLSAFYAALLSMICGFMGAVLVNTILDGALGFAPSELGPHWSMRRPVLISRWQTLLAKWAIAVPLTGALTAVMLLIAVGLLGMDAPTPIGLWLYGWFAAATVSIGTLALIAVVGSLGQMLALIIFIYLGLASAGGTTPVEALPEVLRHLSQLDPLRQILSGTRSILYFEARADAGLTRGLLLTAAGLVFWLAFGAFFVRRYDRRGRHRLDPALIRFVSDSVDEYRAREDDAARGA